MRQSGSRKRASKEVIRAPVAAQGSPVRRSGHAARVDRSRAVILEAAAAMIMERGPAAFSIDALVARTGVAKTTIYRHWPTRRELMGATFSNMTHPGGMPDTGTLRGDLREFFVGGAHAMDDGRWDKHLQTLPGIIEATHRDPDLVEVGTQMLNNTVQALVPMLERARLRGEVRKDVSLEAMAHILLGATFLHRGLGCDLSEAFILEVINSVLDGIKTPSASRATRAPERGRRRRLSG